MLGKGAENIQNTTISFLKPNTDKDTYFEQLINIVNKNNDIPILLVPYSTNKHIVTLIINTATFPEKNSCKYFDSSQCFTNENFPNKLLDAFNKDTLGKIKPINDSDIQGDEGTCSFYTEAFLMLMDEKLQDPKKCNFENITDIVNSKDFIETLQKLKEKYFQEYYKERIEEYDLKTLEEKLKSIEGEEEFNSLETEFNSLEQEKELESMEQEKELESMEQSEKYKNLETEMETELKNIMKQIEKSQQTVQTTAQQTQDKESITQTQKPMPDQVLQSTQNPTPQTIQNQTSQQTQNQNQIQNTQENLSEDLGSAINDLIEQEQKQEQSI